MVYLPTDLLNDVGLMQFGNKANDLIEGFKQKYATWPSSSDDSSTDTSSSDPTTVSSNSSGLSNSQPVKTVSQMDQSATPMPSGGDSSSVAQMSPNQSVAAALQPATAPQPSTAPASAPSAMPDASAPTTSGAPASSWLPSMEDLAGSWGYKAPDASSASASTSPDASSTGDNSQTAKKSNTSWLPSLDDLTTGWKSLTAPADQSAANGGSTAATRATPLTPSGTPQGMPSSADRTNPQLANGQRADISMSAGPIAGDDRDTRIASAAPIAQQVEAKTGMPADVNIAFAVHESGLDPQYAPGMSYHGRHAVEGEDGTPIVDWGYDAQGNRVDYPTKLKSYTTPSGSFQDFANLITTSPIYADAWNTYKQTGDKAQLVKDIWASGYGESKSGPGETVDIMANQVDPAVAAAKQAPASVTIQQPTAGPQGIADGPNWRKTWGDDLTPDQIKSTLAEGMDWDSAIATCGVAAAVAFARANSGNPPTFGQALRLAQGSGEWNSDVGMVHGADGEVALLQQMGVDAHTAPVNQQQIAQAVQNGQPVQIDATGGGGHFFVAQNYDPQSGRFDFGNSVGILKKVNLPVDQGGYGGRHWFSLDELAGLGVGTPTTAIYLGSGQ